MTERFLKLLRAVATAQMQESCGIKPLAGLSCHCAYDASMSCRTVCQQLYWHFTVTKLVLHTLIMPVLYFQVQPVSSLQYSEVPVLE